MNNPLTAMKKTSMLEKECASDIAYSSDNTKVYDRDFKLDRECEGGTDYSRLEFHKGFTADAIFRSEGRHIAVLNFADFTKPGGMYLEGAMAQEEALCRDSYLYNVLIRHKDYYEENKRLGSNGNLYHNRALYSPSVCFFEGKEGFVHEADVITCASPRITSFSRVPKEKNLEVLKDRARFILDIAEDNKAEVLVLGAWGCGVFRQNPSEVAEAFGEALHERAYSFEKVIFEVPEREKLFEMAGTIGRVYGIDKDKDADEWYALYTGRTDTPVPTVEELLAKEKEEKESNER